MTTSPLIRAVLVSAVLSAPVLAPVQAVGQQVRVEEIRRNPAPHVNELRTVEGVVARYVDIRSLTMKAYYLEDDFGHVIQVRTTGSLPPRGSRVTVTGVVALERTGDPYIMAEGSSGSVLAPEEPVVRADSAAQPELSAELLDSDLDGVSDAADRCPNSEAGAVVDEFGCVQGTNMLLYGGLAAVIVAMFILVGALIIRSRQQPQTVAAASPGDVTLPPIAPSAAGPAVAAPTAPASEAVGEEFRGKTIKFVRPPAGTLKLLPGRLEIVGGDDRGEEIRFMKTSEGVPEITFGRSDGAPYTHIQLKAPTVSRKHALMRLEGDRCVIINFSETNPVLVNGQELSASGSHRVLAEGDQIEMGEVTFRFRQ